jgi:hypothetical protein
MGRDAKGHRESASLFHVMAGTSIGADQRPGKTLGHIRSVGSVDAGMGIQTSLDSPDFGMSASTGRGHKQGVTFMAGWLTISSTFMTTSSRL